MRITELEISQIKGVEHLFLKPGTITRIKGANGTGKSSIIDAVMSVFQGGSDPGWLRRGAKKGFVRISICEDTGSPRAEITKTVSRRKDGDGINTTLEILDPNGVPIPAPQTFIARLGESWAVDPSALLAMDTSTATGRKALTAKLLELMPIEFATVDIIAAGVPDAGAPRGPVASLTDVDKARKYVTEMRRKVGIERDEASSSVDALRKSLPNDGEEVDWIAKEKELQAKERGRSGNEAEENAAVAHDAGVERQAQERDFAKAEQAIRAELQKRLDALAVEKTAAFKAIDVAEQAAIATLAERHEPEKRSIADELSTVRERAEQQQRAAGVRASIATFEKRTRAKYSEYDQLTDTLEKLDTLKKSKMDNLPIEGIGFDGDTPLLDGVPWHHVNTARRAMVAAQCCSLRAGELQFMVMDDAEHLDADTRTEYEAAIVAGGFQLMEAVVSDGPLAVENVA